MSDRTQVNVAVSTAARRGRSLVRLAAVRLGSLWRIFWIRSMTSGVVLPWSTAVGRGVSIRATDGGSVRLDAGVKLAANVTIGASGGAVRIGRNAFIGQGTIIVAHANIAIEDGAMLGEHVTVRDQDHDTSFRGPIRAARFRVSPIRISRDVWIGAKATVLMGTTIEADAVIGANAVVKGLIPSAAIATGVPARVKRYRW